METQADIHQRLYFTIHLDSATGRGEVSTEQLQQSGFTSPISANNSYSVPAWHFQVDVIQRDEFLARYPRFDAKAMQTQYVDKLVSLTTMQFVDF
jgi:hypothetical protein